MTADVVIVGGGPAGAATAALLASAGRAVVLVERAPSWRWRACGVFTSPATRAALSRIGVAPTELDAMARPIPAMRVETPHGTRIRLTYGAHDGIDASSALGFDRAALDRRLLELARAAGVDVREGVAMTGLDLGDRGPIKVRLGRPGEPPHVEAARVVVGADGGRSAVARAAWVDRRSPLGPRVALTFHVAEPGASGARDDRRDARMVVIDGGYVGLAPVPGGRVNVGIVLDRRWTPALRREGAAAVAARILRALPADDGASPLGTEPLDSVEGVSPLGHDVRRRAGAGWLLVGDAAGFIDPFTGEGLHRAFVSAELAAETIDTVLAKATGRSGPPNLAPYDRAMGRRFGTKDVVTRIVHGFLARPALFEYAARRLATRDALRETLGLVIGDLQPAGRALDPRYLAAVLAP